MNLDTLTTTCVMKNTDNEITKILIEYDPLSMEVVSSLEGFSFLDRKEMCEFIEETFPGVRDSAVIEESIVYSFFGLFVRNNPNFDTAYITCKEICEGKQKNNA